MLIVVSAILLVLGVLAYRRPLMAQVQRGEGKGQSGEGAWLLVLRLAVLLLFAAIFAGAVLSKVWTVRPKRVAVMLDVSESMNAVKAESTAVAAAEGFTLPTGVARQEWMFGDTATRISDFRLQTADSQAKGRTRIGAALQTVGKTRPGAVVLLSDGQDNGGTDAVAAARAIGVPVYTVGFGGLAKRNLSTERV
ncbi:MAG: VWA domain-containing protein, partial [candidate division WOR-3 bacterium]|nr:VWA domain-containing protein [candidate division WOR-3 bacterium]